MHVLSFRFCSFNNTHSDIEKQFWSKYTKKIIIIKIESIAYRENRFLCNISKTRADWAKLWSFLNSAHPNYSKKVTVCPAAIWLLTSVTCAFKNWKWSSSLAWVHFSITQVINFKNLFDIRIRSSPSCCIYFFLIFFHYLSFSSALAILL